MRFKPAKSGGPLSVSTVCSAVEKYLASMRVLRRAAPHTCGSDSCLILPFAIEVLKDGGHRLPCRLQERGNSNGMMGNKSVRAKAFYAAQLG
jgi:hypothetical protein